MGREAPRYPPQCSGPKKRSNFHDEITGHCHLKGYNKGLRIKVIKKTKLDIVIFW